MRVPRFLAVLPVAVLLTVAAWSCKVDNSPTGVAAGAATPAADLISGVVGTTTSLVGTLLQCTPMPYAQNSKVIGPAGGDLQIGPHVLHVPAGALSQSVLITGQAPSGNGNSVRLYSPGL